MEKLPGPPGRITRKPLSSSNEEYPMPTVPQNFANAPITSSYDDRDGIKEQSHSSATPLMSKDNFHPELSGNEGPGDWKSQPFEVQQQKYASTQSQLFGAAKDWKAEVACCFLGVVSLAAIAATLAPFQGQPLPQLPYSVSLNSLISLYVIMLKAAMFVILCSGLGQLKWTWFGSTRPLRDLERFDEASRGAFGAVKLIWTLRGRNILVTFGALIIIIAIAIDPFAQQIVRYTSCEQISSLSQASIPRTNSFSNRGIHIGANINTVDLGMQSAVNVGVFSPSSVRTPFTCSTGNCTFPQYRSFAYCSTCKDISSEVVITPPNTTLIYSGNSTYTRQDPINFTLPSGLWSSPSTAHQFSMGPSKFPVKIQALLGDSNSPNVNGNVTKTTFSCAPDLEWGCRGYGAAECSLDICIKTYNASIENGKLIETELYSDPAAWITTDPKNNLSSTEFLSTIDMSCVNDTDRQILQQAGYMWNNTTKWLAYFTYYPTGMSASELTASGYNLSHSPLLPINPACVYQTTSNSILSLGRYYSTLFQGHAGVAPQANGATGDIIAAIFNSGNVSDVTLAGTFMNISTSMTNYIRQNGDHFNSRSSVGQVLLSETCVHVRWEWLTFPATLFALTLVFFVGMVIQTTSMYALSSGSHDFKSCALPLVFTGLDAPIPQSLQESRFGMREMAHEARQMHVRLSKTKSGWMFVKDD